jgi:hypothetical protein
MKEKFFYYQGWFYPIQSVSFRINVLDAESDEYTISMFHLHESEAVQLFTGDRAKKVEALLTELSLDLELLEEENSNG